MEEEAGDEENNLASLMAIMDEDETFISAVDDVSWIRNLDVRHEEEMDEEKEQETTISDMKGDEHEEQEEEEDRERLQQELTRLDQRRETLRRKIAATTDQKDLKETEEGSSGDKNTCEQHRLKTSERCTTDEKVMNDGPVMPPPMKAIARKAGTDGRAPITRTVIEGNADTFDARFAVRIRNPKVSSATFGVYCGDMKKIRISELRPNAPPTGDWVSIGVIVDKSGYKKSANGNDFMLWKISDLLVGSNSQEAPAVKLLLFGECLKQRWKLNVGSVLALVGPSWCDSTRNGEVTLKATQPSQLLELGQSPDFAICKGTRKDGQACTNFVNRSLGDHCVFHLMSAAKSFAAKRGALQTPGSIPPKSWNGKALGDFSNVFYGGKMITKSNSAKAINLEQHRAKRAVGKTTEKISAISDAAANEAKNFATLLQSSRTFGARNFMKHTAASSEGHAPLAAASLKKPTVKTFREFIESKKTIRPPTLGRGIKGNVVSLTSPAADRRTVFAEQAKRRAAIILRNKEGKAEQHSSTSLEQKHPSAGDTAKTNNASGGSPIKKRLKLGEINLDDAQLRAILDKKSSHDAEANEADREQEARYFEGMTARERVETRLTGTTEIKNCRVVSCKRCAYTALTQSDFCKMQGHPIKRHTATKRFFKCRDCAVRCHSYDLLPTRKCQCGGNDYERVGMKEERKGPSLPQETLKVRGEERTFVG